MMHSYHFNSDEVIRVYRQRNSTYDSKNKCILIICRTLSLTVMHFDSTSHCTLGSNEMLNALQPNIKITRRHSVVD